MGFYTRDSWDDKLLSMRHPNEVLCKVSLMFHVDSPEFPTVQKALKAVAWQAEYFAASQDRSEGT